MVIEHQFPACPDRAEDVVAPSMAGWHLDKRLPVAMIVMILMQMAIGVWWASKLDSRVERIEHDQSIQRERDQQQDRNMQDAVSRLERQAGDMSAQIRADLGRIDGKLDRLIESRMGKQ